MHSLSFVAEYEDDADDSKSLTNDIELHGNIAIVKLGRSLELVHQMYSKHMHNSLILSVQRHRPN